MSFTSNLYAGIHDMGQKFGQLRLCPREIWLIYAMKFLEATAMFSTTYVAVKYLSDELGMSDLNAGWVYGGYGTVTSIVGFVIGFMVDNLGVRTSLLMGGALLLLSRVMVSLGSSATQVTVVFLTLYPIGAALMIPVQMLALRRYTTESSRKFAFSLFYVCMNVAAVVASFIINGVRRMTPPTGVDVVGLPFVSGWHLSMNRIVLLTGVACTIIMMIVATQIREINMGEGFVVQEYQPRQGGPRQIMREVFSQSKFWRFFAITVIFVGVKTNFSHMDATFPKYFTREFGEDAPYELLLAINPAMIIFLVPIATYLIDKFHVGFGPVLLIGSFISGSSPFVLAASNTYGASIMWLFLLSIGEAIWSPKLMEFSVAIAPEGREGTYMSLAGAPLFLSKLGTGGLSGHLLERYCPETGPRDPQMMWFIIGLTTFVPSLMLLVLMPYLIVEQDWKKDPLEGKVMDKEEDPFVDAETTSCGSGSDYHSNKTASDYHPSKTV